MSKKAVSVFKKIPWLWVLGQGQGPGPGAGPLGTGKETSAKHVLKKRHIFLLKYGVLRM